MQRYLHMCISFLFLGCTDAKVDLRELQLQQLGSTHKIENWFVPFARAVKGLTPGQSTWKGESGNHSIAELTSHLIFWNERELMSFNGEEIPLFEGENRDTFEHYAHLYWHQRVKRFDSIQSLWQQKVNEARPEQLREWAETISNMTAHNAYHIGQIVYISKANQWWN